MLSAAKFVLLQIGPKVMLATYQGGHGWHGDVFGEIHQGIGWLEVNVSESDATPEPVQSEGGP